MDWSVESEIDLLSEELAGLPGDQMYRDGATYALDNLKGRLRLMSREPLKTASEAALRTDVDFAASPDSALWHRRLSRAIVSQARRFKSAVENALRSQLEDSRTRLNRLANAEQERDYWKRTAEGESDQLAEAERVIGGMRGVLEQAVADYRHEPSLHPDTKAEIRRVLALYPASVRDGRRPSA